MKKSSLFSLALIGAAVVLPSCKEDFASLGEVKNEEYVKAFINEFGVPDGQHTYTMATSGMVTVTTDRPTDITVEAWVNEKRYTFAQRKQLNGTAILQFDIPKSVEYVTVAAGNELHKVALGGELDLRGVKPAWSRASESKTFEIDRSKSFYNYYSANVATETGFIKELYQATNAENPISGIYSKRQGWHHAMSGWELEQYLQDTKTNQDFVKYAEDARMIYDGTLNYEYIINFKRINGHNMEFGRLYGDKANLEDATRYRLVPIYQTISNTTEIADKNHKTYPLDERETLEDYGYTVVIDYNAASRWSNGVNVAKTGEIGSDGVNGGNKWGTQGKIEITSWDDGDHCWFRNMLRDETLKADLERASKVFNKLPDPMQVQIDKTSVEGILDAYSESDKVKFYEQWDAYMDYWLGLNPDVDAELSELLPIKQLLNMHHIVIKKGVKPTVEELSEGRYEVKFVAAKNFSPIVTHNYNTAIDATTGSIIVNDDNRFQVFDSQTPRSICFEGEKDNLDCRGSEYVYYVRDLDAGDGLSNLVTSIDPDRVKVLRRHVKLPGGYDGGYSLEEPFVYIDVDGDGDYSDIVFAVGNNQAIKTTTFHWILACEDLGSTDDWDFNDLVVGINTGGNGDDGQKVYVTPLAAGGIYPLYLMWNDFRTGDMYIVGKEIHKWLGCDELRTFNTDAEIEKAGHQITFEYDVVNHGGVRFSLADDKDKFYSGKAMNGFWVLVDKDNVIADNEAKLLDPSGSNPNRKLQSNFNKIDQASLTYLLKAYPSLYQVTNDDNSQAPVARMILVGNDWKWPRERVHINAAYNTPGSTFSDWVKNRNVIWYPCEGNDEFVTNRDKQ